VSAELELAEAPRAAAVEAAGREHDEQVALLGRPRLRFRLPDLSGERVLVTGAEGFLGSRLGLLCEELGATVIGVDLPEGDVLSPAFREWLAAEDARAPFDRAFHLAAHKYAPLGEERPAAVADLNVRGTAHIVKLLGERVVLASTCKAADPWTVYGASKLIAERIVLNASGRVLRLVNVLGSTGSVLAIWNAIPPTEPLPVTLSTRFWLTSAEACEALVCAAAALPGRYTPNVELRGGSVSALADRAFPDRPQRLVPRRRGDRPIERLLGSGESFEDAGVPGLLRIRDPW
jgi:FlaA1/EpsC-like NDP-sugar epimerase